MRDSQKILLVSGDAAVRESMGKCLACAGCAVSGAADAASALKGLREGRPDLVLIAVQPERLEARAEEFLRGILSPPSGGSFRIAEFAVDAVDGVLLAPDGTRSELSLREVELLRHFSAHPGETFGRDFLLAKFWGRDYSGNESALTTAIHRLRRKLGESGAMLRTIPRKGYRLESGL